MENSVLAKKVTMYQRANTPDKLYPVSLLDVLQSKRYKSLAEQCRRIINKKERQGFKLQNVPVITPGGLFDGRRKADNLIQHSGLVCLDLDGVEDTVSLKEKVSDLSFVAYCGKSISGSGLFVIVHIPESSPEEHKRRYAALEHYFIKKFGIDGAVDPQPKNVSACRYVSYDPDSYFNHDANIFTGIDEAAAPTTISGPSLYQNIPQKPSRRYSTASDYEKVSEIVEYIQRRGLDFCPDYDDYLRVAFSLAKLGEPGRHLFHSVCQYSSKYDKHDADTKFTDALKNGNNKISLGTFFGMCDDYGLMTQKDTWEIIKPKPLKARNKREINVSTGSPILEEINTAFIPIKESGPSDDQSPPQDDLFCTPNKPVQRCKIVISDSLAPKNINAYTNHANELLMQNPVVDDLVDRIRAEQDEQEPNVFSLEDLANGNKEGYYASKKEEVLIMLEKYGNVNRPEAENCFNTLLQDGSIEPVSSDYYYIR